MSGPFVDVIANTKGSGDHFIVMMEGELMMEGSIITPNMLFDLLKWCNGFEYIKFHELTDEEIKKWEEVIYN